MGTAGRRTKRGRLGTEDSTLEARNFEQECEIIASRCIVIQGSISIESTDRSAVVMSRCCCVIVASGVLLKSRVLTCDNVCNVSHFLLFAC